MTRPRIAVIDHGAGNLVSITQALERCQASAEVVSAPADMENVDGVVLPGVGATGSVMAGIADAGLVDHLRGLSVPLLGICVGMQVLFDSSDEDEVDCLGLLSGRVRRLEAPTLPHIGWNDIAVAGTPVLLQGLPDPVVYFVHSYAPVPDDASVIAATAVHGQEFVAAVAQGAVYGVQFHPERSGPAGLRILHRFVSVCAGAERAA